MAPDLELNSNFPDRPVIKRKATMNQAEYDQLLSKSLHRKLTAEEEMRLQRYFAAHPEVQAGWEEDMSLNRCLRHLPDAPLASNFTAQVWLKIGPERQPFSRESWMIRCRDWARSLNLAQRAATAAMILCLAALSYYQYLGSTRQARARSLAEFSSVASLTSVDTLRDFETIRRLSLVDTELLEHLK